MHNSFDVIPQEKNLMEVEQVTEAPKQFTGHRNSHPKTVTTKNLNKNILSQIHKTQCKEV